MSAVRRLFLPSLLAVAGIACEVLIFYRCCPLELPRPPRASLAEIALLARERGLYARSERADGAMGSRLVVSDRPLSVIEANSLCLSDPAHYRWRGTLTVSIPWPECTEYCDPDYSLLWRGLFLFGDREIMRRLTGRPASRAPKCGGG